MTQTMTSDEALDFAFDHYLAGNIDVNLPSDASPAQIEQALAPWGVRVNG